MPPRNDGIFLKKEEEFVTTPNKLTQPLKIPPLLAAIEQGGQAANFISL